MSNAIRFLETLGQDPALARMSPQQWQALIEGLDVEADQRQALQHGDAAALSELVGGRARMMCLIIAPGDEPDSHTPPDEDEPQDEPEPDDQA